jgi:hypothetical protein
MRLPWGVQCPVLVTLGSVEMETNMAFRGALEELAALRLRHKRLEVVQISGGDHFYTSVRPQLVSRIESWLRSN